MFQVARDTLRRMGNPIESDKLALMSGIFLPGSPGVFNANIRIEEKEILNRLIKFCYFAMYYLEFDNIGLKNKILEVLDRRHWQSSSNWNTPEFSAFRDLREWQGYVLDDLLEMKRREAQAASWKEQHSDKEPETDVVDDLIAEALSTVLGSDS
jgi:hypothetical protein